MIVIISGSRRIIQFDIGLAVRGSGFDVTEVVAGRERKGIDRLAEAWANAMKIPFQPFPADWDNLTHPDAKIITRGDGSQYDTNARPLALTHDSVGLRADQPPPRLPRQYRLDYRKPS
jgi:hypothetical protein